MLRGLDGTELYRHRQITDAILIDIPPFCLEFGQCFILLIESDWTRASDYN